MQCSLAHLPTHSPSRRLRDIFLTIAISLAWMPLFQCLIENPFAIYIEQTNALLVLRCIIMFKELSVCFEKIVSLQSCHANVFFFAGICYSENAFHPEHFLSFLCTSSGGQSKYFIYIPYCWTICPLTLAYQGKPTLGSIPIFATDSSLSPSTARHRPSSIQSMASHRVPVLGLFCLFSIQVDCSKSLNITFLMCIPMRMIHNCMYHSARTQALSSQQH